MHKPKTKTYLLPQNIRSLHLASLLASLPSLFTTACSTTYRRHEIRVRVHDEINLPPPTLKEERASALIMEHLQAEASI